MQLLMRKSVKPRLIICRSGKRISKCCDNFSPSYGFNTASSKFGATQEKILTVCDIYIEQLMILAAVGG